MTARFGGVQKAHPVLKLSHSGVEHTLERNKKTKHWGGLHPEDTDAEVKMEMRSNGTMTLHGVADEPLKLRRKMPWYMNYLKYLSLLAILAGAIVTLVVKQDYFIGLLMGILSVLGGILTAIATPGSAVTRAVQVIQDTPPSAIRDHFWSGLGVVVSLIPAVPALLADCGQGFATAAVVVVSALIDLTPFAFITRYLRGGIGMIMALGSLILDPDNFAVVLAGLLMGVKGIGDMATKKAKELAEEADFGDFDFGVDGLKKALDMGQDQIAALAAVGKGALDKLSRQKMLTALKDLVRSVGWKGVIAARTVSRLVMHGKLKDMSKAFEEGAVDLSREALNAIAEARRECASLKPHDPLPLDVRKKSAKSMWYAFNSVQVIFRGAVAPAKDFLEATAGKVQDKVNNLVEASGQSKKLLNTDLKSMLVFQILRFEQAIVRLKDHFTSVCHPEQLEAKSFEDRKTILQETTGEMSWLVEEQHLALGGLRKMLSSRTGSLLKRFVPDGKEDSAHKMLQDLVDQEHSFVEEMSAAVRSASAASVTLSQESGHLLHEALAQFQNMLYRAEEFPGKVRDWLAEVPIDDISRQFIEALISQMGAGDDEEFVGEFTALRQVANAMSTVATVGAEHLLTMMDHCTTLFEYLEEIHDECSGLSEEVAALCSAAALKTEWLLKDGLEVPAVSSVVEGAKVKNPFSAIFPVLNMEEAIEHAGDALQPAAITIEAFLELLDPIHDRLAKQVVPYLLKVSELLQELFSEQALALTSELFKQLTEPLEAFLGDPPAEALEDDAVEIASNSSDESSMDDLDLANETEDGGKGILIPSMPGKSDHPNLSTRV